MTDMETERVTGPQVSIAAAGASVGTPAIGGWAAILRMGPYEKVLQGRAGRAIEDRMQLMAVVEALDILTEPCRVAVTCSNRYPVFGVRSPHRLPMGNADLWKRLDRQRQTHRIEWAVSGERGQTVSADVAAAERLARTQAGRQRDNEKRRKAVGRRR